ncbi:hypothetical protein AVEN_159275-1 [Araneus ventricosus]|uniref:Uncharacterized protein n=1 Tax=Araneus ventricosus TaxID=182803 RepID=A0A4Y2A2K6_ARAVE|nr:hypothetical protein AVEN_159275-1 [Araneus ventricosus]
MGIRNDLFQYAGSRFPWRSSNGCEIIADDEVHLLLSWFHDGFIDEWFGDGLLDAWFSDGLLDAWFGDGHLELATVTYSGRPSHSDSPKVQDRSKWPKWNCLGGVASCDPSSHGYGQVRHTYELPSSYSHRGTEGGGTASTRIRSRQIS